MVKKRKELYVQSVVFKTCTTHYRSGRTEVFCGKVVTKTLGIKVDYISTDKLFHSIF